MKNTPKNVMIWPVVILLLVGLLQVRSSNMLCISSDGEVDFESLCIPGNEIADDECCTEVCSENRDEKECNDCSDLELQFSVLNGRIFHEHNSQLQQLINHNITTILLKKSIILDANIFFYNHNQNHLTNPPHPDLNSTVLIC